jgi:hypothetical protein
MILKLQLLEPVERINLQGAVQAAFNKLCSVRCLLLSKISGINATQRYVVAL